jgi:hypothetical protein
MRLLALEESTTGIMAEAISKEHLRAVLVSRLRAGGVCVRVWDRARRQPLVNLPLARSLVRPSALANGTRSSTFLRQHCNLQLAMYSSAQFLEHNEFER